MSVASSNGGPPRPPPPFPPRPNSPDLFHYTNEILIIQAQTLLEDIEKTLYLEIRRCRTIYGKHFPELGLLVKDNTIWIKVVKRIGRRANLPNVDLGDLLPPRLEMHVAAAAKITRGVAITDESLATVTDLCDHINLLFHNRTFLRDLLEERMRRVAPYLTGLVGALLGAKLIVHAGFLMNIARRQPVRRTYANRNYTANAAEAAAEQDGGESDAAQSADEADDEGSDQEAETKSNEED